MIDKIIWQWLMPTMARLPLLCKLATRIYTKTLADIVIQSINHYKEIMESDSTLFKACPLSRGFMAMMSLMPVAIIYYYLKLNQETGR